MTKGTSQPSGRNRQTKEATGKPQTLGYPTLEKLIEEQDSRALNFDKSRNALNELLRKSSDSQEKVYARQALLAYDRFQHFFDEMIKLREKMIQERIEEQNAQEGKKTQARAKNQKK